VETDTGKCVSDVVAKSQMIYQMGACIQDRLELTIGKPAGQPAHYFHSPDISIYILANNNESKEYNLTGNTSMNIFTKKGTSR